MEANYEETSGSGTAPEGENSVGETVEIKIKTLDSQSYTLRVEKNVAVPALKEQLASVVGVPVENQRLICRGKVLKDDQLLSAYNVEDGHTLHLVARQPPPTSGVGPSGVGNEGGHAGETGLPPPEGRSGHVSHSLLMGTINFPDNGEGQMPDLNRIINAVISSIGMHGGVPLQGGTGNADSSTTGMLPTGGGGDGGAGDGRNGGGEQDAGVRELELQIDALYGVPSNAGGTTGPSPIRVVQAPMVVPDALTTMSQYLDRLEQSFAAEESARTSNIQDVGPSEARVASDVRTSREEGRREASPAALGALVNRVNNLLRGQAGSALSRLASRLESEPTMLDAAAREDVQHAAYRDGNVMQQIGALLLELGRVTLSLRMGQSPSESVVNTGPAIFISPTGPNPMMVQGANVASFRQVFDLSGIHRHNIALPPQSGGGGAVGSGLPSTTAGGTGFTVRQLLERAERAAAHGGGASNGASGGGRGGRSSNDGGEGANPVAGSLSAVSSGMQGALMTFDENGAMRVVPVRSRGGGGGNLGDPLLAGFHQHRFNFRPASSPPNDGAGGGATYPPPSASTESPRQMDQASPSLPGEGGGAGSGAGNGEVADLMSSLAPLLQHFAGALQQSGAPTPLQQQLSNSETPQQPTSTDTVEGQAEGETRPGEGGQGSRESANGESVEAGMESGVTSMVSDDVIGDTERPGSSPQPSPEGQTVEAGGSVGPSGEILGASVTAPVGLGLGGLQPLPARGRRRRQAQQSGQDGERQAVRESLESLRGTRDVGNETNQRMDVGMPSLGQLVRAIGGGGGGERQQSGSNIIGQLMRSPVVENLVQQVMQGVGDVDGGAGVGGRRGGPGGGLDLSGMLQHVVPVVTQMLNSPAAFPGSAAGTSARAFGDGAGRGGASRESEAERWQDALTPEEAAGWSETIAADEEVQQSMAAQRPLSDVYRRGTPAAKRQKTAVETAAEKLEDGGPAGVVLRDLADAASAEVSGNNGATSTDESAQQAVRVDGLAEAYLVVLFNDLAARVAADPDFGDGSRFPHAARIFQQSPQTATKPDGERH